MKLFAIIQNLVVAVKLYRELHNIKAGAKNMHLFMHFI